MKLLVKLTTLGTLSYNASVLLAQAPPENDPNRVQKPVSTSPQPDRQETQPTEEGKAISFACAMSQKGGPTTVAQTPRGDIPIILWSSQDFSKPGFNPKLRCQVVSARFQTLYSRGNFNYIVPGVVNNLPVICATNEKNNFCNDVFS